MNYYACFVDVKYIPNILTGSRIAAVPFITWMLCLSTQKFDCFAFFLFLFATITDYFDGYLARLLTSVSKIGAFMDPIADKLLITNVLLLLSYRGVFDEVGIACASVIVFREIFVSELRKFMTFPVSLSAKFKTLLQMVSLGCILFCLSFKLILSNEVLIFIDHVGYYLLVLSAINSFISCVQYVIYCFNCNET
ncbi:CDP-diacylglycerol--glycerol-3-phosphate 3-phosphatidyltransferase [Candidatus Gromoviella agglomerans]|uniref:CDP-diacylglycerol--glycerol-3-phosphate 3-phosphatidyltransferase n=1 Tax=Candidatus Gromoviella agglomerans TaxID=2806609 RepID=UPI001E59E4DC|nr:CDP-diacylglycerol--glycerol-3-phosphate 3-phosphatidyltransferase [Candidatus Gromoviella agglomerans]UFX98305.1 CDP-diacylglycerol--glycerol-3-phosphate 3-phosphatidyltransferase [Candidatus Gromoviella agglomerans]